MCNPPAVSLSRLNALHAEHELVKALYCYFRMIEVSAKTVVFNCPDVQLPSIVNVPKATISATVHQGRKVLLQRKWPHARFRVNVLPLLEMHGL